ncbi:allantoicase [Actinocorallia longicatena]|uniref:Probable allantoicase n=1 Tax=Actinocorallia longicatena TaxID=111803 RepID=A0ABP6QF70_9ACTN
MPDETWPDDLRPDELTFDELTDLASRALGGGVVAANDEFFAERENLLTPDPAVYSPHTFGLKGQVYDGWETRRRRKGSHDTAYIRLGAPGVVRGVVVDTAFFTGNYPPSASVEGCRIGGYPSVKRLKNADWFPLVERAALKGDTANSFAVAGDGVVTHVRLRIFPDGGVARLRVHGVAVPDPALLPGVFDLAGAEVGGRVTDWSDRFYGSPRQLLLPGLAANMGGGWETRRRRDDGNDWVEIALGQPGVPEIVELDTSHFKGNAPGWASVTASDGTVLLPRVRLQPDTRHRFRVAADRAVEAVRLDIYPDGGMARFRLHGAPTAKALKKLKASWS